MEIKREDLNPCTVQLEIACDAAQVKQGLERAMKRAAKRVKIPGFRPGHAPKSLVEQQINHEAVQEIALDDIVRDAYAAAVKDQELAPYTTGSVEVKSFDAEEGKCEFVAKIPLKPQVEIGDYSSLPVERPQVDVTDEEVESQLEDMRKRHSTREAVVDRGVEEGDVALVNIKVDGDEGDGRTFMTVAGKTFPQMDQALMGMKTEDMKVLDLAFPDNFQEKDWAGKPFHCQMTLRSLSSMKLPETEEFARTFKLENGDELRSRIRQELSRQKEAMVREYVNQQLLDALMQRSSVCVPDTMWERVAAQKLQDVVETLETEQRTLADFAKENGMTEEEFVDAQRNEAKTYVMRAQLIQDLFIKENMAVTNIELGEALQEMAAEYRIKPDELLQTLKKNNSLREIHYQAIHRKVMDFLNSRAETREVAQV